MPVFSYRARDVAGKLVEGTLDAPDRTAVVRQLERQKCVPFSIKSANGSTPAAAAPAAKPAEKAPASAEKKVDAKPEKKPEKKAEKPEERPTAASERAKDASLRLSHTHRLLLTEQLAYLLSAGMTLDEALSVMHRRLKVPALQQISSRLHQLLVDGRSFSQALAEFPKSFPPLYVHLVQAGEASGALPEILQRLVKHLNDVKALRDRVQQALLYPSILSIFGILLIILFITVLVPQLTGFLAKTGGALPLPTRILLGVNDFIVKWWPAAVATIFGGFALFKVFTRTQDGKEAWDRFRLKIPGYGAVVSYRFFAQFARTMATLLKNGVTLLRAVELLANVADNAWLRRCIMAARGDLFDGSSLSKSVTRQGIFPELMVDMMAVGEQTGRFAETMTMIADIYERELNKKVEIATALIPVVIVIVIALIIGCVVFAIMSAVFSITSGLKNKAG